jgi:hypothetical protein
VVAFQVDELDVGARTGWSVLGVGEAYEVVEPDRLARLAGHLQRPWVPAPDPRTICIPLQRLTGRRMG